MKDCSVVTATYELGEGMKGTIGIIGPKRMDYEHVMKTLKILQGDMIPKISAGSITRSCFSRKGAFHRLSWLKYVNRRLHRSAI